MNKDFIIEKFISNKKRTYQELELLFNLYLNNKLSDEDMTIVLKMICKYEMRYKEIEYLTDIFIKSGIVMDFSDIEGIILDKHSTGGIGDKTTLIVVPIVASLNLKVAKMSGRGLGYTGGTIDKLESINVNTNLSLEEFKKEVKDINMAIISQTDKLCPLDGKVYALRDVTNTTRSISLIASSVMSKKIASGASKIVIDIKVGSGSLIRTKKDARKLAKIMIKLGKKYNREVVCMISDMNTPLGYNIGNTLEIEEVLEILNNKKKHTNLYKTCISLSSLLVSLGKNISVNEAKKEVIKTLETGKALEKFKEFVKYQNGNLNIKEVKGREIYSLKDGYINKIDALKIGIFSCELGAGRKEKGDQIDYTAGIKLNHIEGDYVKKGDILCTLYGKCINEDILSAFEIGKKKKHKKEKLIIIEYKRK